MLRCAANSGRFFPVRVYVRSSSCIPGTNVNVLRYAHVCTSHSIVEPFYGVRSCKHARQAQAAAQAFVINVFVWQEPAVRNEELRVNPNYVHGDKGCPYVHTYTTAGKLLSAFSRRI